MGDVRSGALYSARSNRLAGMRPHMWLWVLVLIEIGLLVVMRVQFRRYHGG